MTRVVVIAHHPLVRAGLVSELTKKGAEVVAVESAARALPLVERGDVAALFLEVDTIVDAIADCRVLREARLTPPITGVDSRSRSPGDWHRLESAGMTGYVDCEQGLMPLDHALSATERGQVIVSRAGRHAGRRDGLLIPSEQMPNLDETNARILDLLAVGYRDNEVANELGFSSSAVHHRVEALEHNLEARTRFQFGCLPVWHGLVIPGDPGNSADLQNKLS